MRDPLDGNATLPAPLTATGKEEIVAISIMGSLCHIKRTSVLYDREKSRSILWANDEVLTNDEKRGPVGGQIIWQYRRRGWSARARDCANFYAAQRRVPGA